MKNKVNEGHRNRAKLQWWLGLAVSIPALLLAGQVGGFLWDSLDATDWQRWLAWYWLISYLAVPVFLWQVAGGRAGALGTSRSRGWRTLGLLLVLNSLMHSTVSVGLWALHVAAKTEGLVP